MSEFQGPGEEVLQYAEHEDSFPTSVEITPEFIEQLKHASSPQERQAISDSVFSEWRRQEMLAEASKDRKGRPVRYYRRIKLPKMYDMLQKGEQTAYDYFDDLDAPVNEDRAIVRRLGEFAKSQGLITDEERHTVWRHLSLAEVLTRLREVYPNLPPLSASPTYGEVLEFMDQMPLWFVANLHSGGLHQKFSPYLSLSVGGPLQDELFPEIALVECVLPDSDIYLQPHWTEQEVQYGLGGVNGEKEVYTKKIPVSSITKIYFSPDTYLQDFIKSDKAVTAPYKLFNKSHPIEAWRWNTTILDYLPADLAEKAIEEYTK